jgi:hypothetical protein
MASTASQGGGDVKRERLQEHRHSFAGDRSEWGLHVCGPIAGHSLALRRLRDQAQGVFAAGRSRFGNWAERLSALLFTHAHGRSRFGRKSEASRFWDREHVPYWLGSVTAARPGGLCCVWSFDPTFSGKCRHSEPATIVRRNVLAIPDQPLFTCRLRTTDRVYEAPDLTGAWSSGAAASAGRARR